uniref:DUF952 domain-containing protein n=1 Tax=Fibrocapsa japonica TaxID=94617 RepID=A0A7S2Y1U0_9STRA
MNVKVVKVVSEGSNMVLIYHLAEAELWDSSCKSNTPYFPPTYEMDGFIHATKELKTLNGIANHFYKDSLKDYILLEIDTDKLEVEVKFEAPADVGHKSSDGVDTTELFPHIFGPLHNGPAIARVLPVIREEDGSFANFEES